MILSAVRKGGKQPWIFPLTAVSFTGKHTRLHNTDKKANNQSAIKDGLCIFKKGLIIA